MHLDIYDEYDAELRVNDESTVDLLVMNTGYLDSKSDLIGYNYYYDLFASYGLHNDADIDEPVAIGVNQLVD